MHFWELGGRPKLARENGRPPSLKQTLTFDSERQTEAIVCTRHAELATWLCCSPLVAHAGGRAHCATHCQILTC
eukprot:4090604-Amphidinium_carterae.1